MMMIVTCTLLSRTLFLLPEGYCCSPLGLHSRRGDETLGITVDSDVSVQ